MFRVVCALLLVLSLSFCEAEDKPPYLLYEAKFDVADVDKAEHVIKEISKKWDLRVYEKDREQMKFLTQGKEAFFIALYFNKNPVLFLNNTGVGEVLTVMAVDHGGMPTRDLERLVAEVNATFKVEFELKFERSNESTALIDVDQN